MEKWAGIVRVSHMGKRKAESERFHADADQVAEVERYAAAHEAEVVFMDPPELNVSGGKKIEERPPLKQAIEGVEAGLYTGIVSANLKRLTRSRSGIEIWDRVEGAGGSVHCAAENLDTSTPNGRFIRDIHLAEAVREREEHAERFETRTRLATEAGVWQRRQVPRGFVRDEETRSLVLEEAGAREVRDAARDFLAGASIVALAERLGMTPSGVRYMLRNRVYLGELRVRSYVNPDAHPAILDEDTFEAVQVRLGASSRPGRGDGQPGLLAGICRCASCGHVMTRGPVKGGSAYRCQTHHSGERCPRPVSILARKLEGFVEPQVVEFLHGVDVSSRDGDRVAGVRAERREAERERDVYLESVSAAEVGAEAFRRGARVRQDRVERLVAAERLALAAQGLGPELLTAARRWNEWDRRRQNALLRDLLQAVVVRPLDTRVPAPVGDRVSVVGFGVELRLPHGRGGAGGIVPLVVPEGGDVGALGILGVADPLNRAQGAVDVEADDGAEVHAAS